MHMLRPRNKYRALLVNPWVYDFKAFDFWNKPVGLLIVGSVLKSFGIHVTLLDCMDRSSTYYQTKTKTDIFGRGKYTYEIIEKPSVFKNVPRHYKRYGMPEKQFVDIVQGMKQPDIIFVTSMMTYWYPGVFKAIRILKDTFPKIHIVLGGIYATLCTRHAREKSGADFVLEGTAESHLPRLLSKFGYIDNSNFKPQQVMPDFSLYDNLSYGVVLTSRGCPFECTYCATKILCPGFRVMPKNTVIEQLSYLAQRTRNVAFFDDALLFNKELPHLLGDITERNLGLRLHASNGLHCRFIDEFIADKMHRADFKTMYLSLETVNPDIQKQTGGKVDTDEFIRAVKILKKVGFPSDAIHTYLLYGMPGQGEEEIVSSINLCKELSVKPHLCEFSPIPHTKEYEKTGFDENTDPLYHNNLFYTWYYPYTKSDAYHKIKRLLT